MMPYPVEQEIPFGNCYYCNEPESDYWFTKKIDHQDVHFFICDPCLDIYKEDPPE